MQGGRLAGREPHTSPPRPALRLPTPCCNPLPPPAAPQLRRSFEDLYSEALRIRAGQPTLPMASLPCGGLPCGAAAHPTDDPTSVLERLSAASAASSTSSGTSSSSCRAGRAGRPSGAAVAASSATAPASHPVPLARLLSAASGCLEDLLGASVGASVPPAAAAEAALCSRNSSHASWAGVLTVLSWLLAALPWLLAALGRAMPWVAATLHGAGAP